MANEKHTAKRVLTPDENRKKENAAKCARRAADPNLIAKNRIDAAAWRDRNVERARAFRQERYTENKDELNAKSREWHAKNRELSRAKSRAWYAANKDMAAADARERRRLNPGAEWARTKISATLRLTKAMRCRLRSAVVLGRGHKSDATLSLIGCTPDALRVHLEAQFEPWMTWDNYGIEWHVDHIRQCSLFDMTDPAQQRECFHYSNLRPLSVAENLTRPRYRRSADLAVAA